MHRLLAPVFLALFAAPAAADPAPPGPEPLRVAATPVEFVARTLDESGPDRLESGRLRYRGGLVLSSDDSRFGGLSGLHVGADGIAFLAVSDIGYWLEGRLAYRDGRLAGLSDVRIAPLLGPDGAPVAGSKRLGDAEALRLMPDGTALVSFERNHRIWRYDLPAAGLAAAAAPVPMPDALAGAVANKGLEALAVLPDGTVLAFTEATMTPEGHILGWRGVGRAAPEAALVRVSPFDLTDMAWLPTGGLLTLERRYSTLGGVGAQMRLVSPAALAGTAPLDGEIVYRSKAGETVDNMEGLAVRRGPDGETLIYAVSDDNFNAVQRTLLMMFELAP